MKGLQEKNGITLIALIVTVIILLILASVSISMVSGEGLFTRARISAEKYKSASINESDELRAMENILDFKEGNVIFNNEEEIAKYESENQEGRYTVSINKGNNILTVNGAGKYNPGDTVVLTAITKEDYINYTGETEEVNNNIRNKNEYTYTFEKWEGDFTGTNSTLTFTMPESNVQVTASAIERVNTTREKYTVNANAPNKLNFTVFYDSGESVSTNVNKESIELASYYYRIEYGRSNGVYRVLCTNRNDVKGKFVCSSIGLDSDWVEPNDTYTFTFAKWETI